LLKIQLQLLLNIIFSLFFVFFQPKVTLEKNLVKFLKSLFLTSQIELIDRTFSFRVCNGFNSRFLWFAGASQLPLKILEQVFYRQDTLP